MFIGLKSKTSIWFNYISEIWFFVFKQMYLKLSYKVRIIALKLIENYITYGVHDKINQDITKFKLYRKIIFFLLK